MRIEREMKLVGMDTQLLQLDWISVPAVGDGLLGDWGRLAVS